MLARVQNDGEHSENVPCYRVKPGYVVAPAQSNMMLFTMLTDAFHAYDDGFQISYHLQK